MSRNISEKKIMKEKTILKSKKSITLQTEKEKRIYNKS